MKILERKKIHGLSQYDNPWDQKWVVVEDIDSMISEIEGYISAQFGNPEDKLTLVKETIKKYKEAKDVL